MSEAYVVHIFDAKTWSNFFLLLKNSRHVSRESGNEKGRRRMEEEARNSAGMRINRR